MQFTCARFPEGEIPIRTVAGVVGFRDGAADVTDPVMAAALAEVPAAFGVSWDEDELAELIGDGVPEDLQEPPREPSGEGFPEGSGEPNGEGDDEPSTEEESADPEDGEGEPTPILDPPAAGDSRADWLAYAVAVHDLDPDSKLTKRQIIEYVEQREAAAGAGEE